MRLVNILCKAFFIMFILGATNLLIDWYKVTTFWHWFVIVGLDGFLITVIIFHDELY